MNSKKIKRHLKRKYFKHHKKIITLCVKREEELYNSFDGTGETLTSEVTKYLEENVETLLPLGQITIAIDSEQEIDISRFSRALHIYYGIRVLNSDRVEKMYEKKQLYLFLGAIVSFVIAYNTTNIMREIFSFLASLAIWQFCDALVFTDDREAINSYIYNILDDAEVIKNSVTRE